VDMLRASEERYGSEPRWSGTQFGPKRMSRWSIDEASGALVSSVRRWGHADHYRATPRRSPSTRSWGPDDTHVHLHVRAFRKPCASDAEAGAPWPSRAARNTGSAP